MESGQRFAIREGGKTIGAGNISEISLTDPAYYKSIVSLGE